MNFENFLNQAWSDHATKTEEVAARFPQGIDMIEKDAEIPQLARLITHVMGEHLGKWAEGVNLLGKLDVLPCRQAESAKALNRFKLSLRIAEGSVSSADRQSTSDQIQSLAIAASALVGQNQTERGTQLFIHALDLAKSGIDKEDPANRALAVAGNNLACALEEKSNLTAAEKDLMVLAAKTGRTYWEIAGGWYEVMFAEYRLAKTYLQAQELEKAHEHANTCFAIAQKNQASAEDIKYAEELLSEVGY